MPTQNPEQANVTKLPQSLVERLILFRSQLRKRKAWEVGLAGLLTCTVSFIAFTVLDRIMDSSMPLRALFFSIGCLALVMALPLWLIRWVIPYSTPIQIAHLIAKHYPRMGDRLLGIIELQSHQIDNPVESTGLRKAAVAVVAKEIASRNIEAALPKSHTLKWLYALAIICFSILITGVQSPKTLSNSFLRWSMPFAEVTRYTSTQIVADDLKKIRYCAINEPFSVHFQLTQKSAIPAKARAKMNNGKWMDVAISNRQFEFELPPILSDCNFELQAGDSYHKMRIQPVARPKIISGEATIQYPEYIEKPTDTRPLHAGNLKLLKGSQAKLSLTPSREILSANAQFIGLDGELEIKLDISDNTINLDKLVFAEEAQTIQVTISDIYGLQSHTPYTVELSSNKDAQPRSRIKITPKSEYILEGDQLTVEVSFTDDYGIQSSGISWNGTVDDTQIHRSANGVLELPKDPKNKKQQDSQFNLSLSSLKVRPQTLKVRSWSTDAHPEHKKSYSEPVELRILSISEHREIIDQIGEDVIIGLEESLQEELEIYDNLRRLVKSDEGQFFQKKQRLIHYDLRDNESNNINLIHKIAQQLDSLVIEANRNTSLKQVTRTTFAKAAHSVHRLNDQLMTPVLNEISFSLQQSHHRDSSVLHLQNAIDNQKHSIRTIEATLELMHLAKQNLQVSSFINRLKEAADNQEQIRDSIVESLLESQTQNISIIGQEFVELDPTQQRKIVKLYALHQTVSQNIRDIIKDLNGYASRSQQKEYLDLVQKIQETDVEEALEALSYELENNHGVLVTVRAKHNAAMLENWAKILSMASSNNASGAGAGGDTSSQINDDDVEFMLRVMQIIKEQQQIRESNRSLHQFKPKP